MGVAAHTVSGERCTMAKVYMRKRSRIVLPKVIVEQLDLLEGTELEVQVVDGKVVMEPMVSIPRSKTRYWTDDWQAAEREADRDIGQGHQKGAGTSASQETND